MKNLLAAILLLTTFTSCKKEANKNCFTIKYIDGVCADRVYEIITPEFQYLGEDYWEAAKDKALYHNVFRLENYCESITLNGDGTANVFLSTKDVSFDCITCLAVYPKPLPKSLTVKQCK